MKLPLCPRFVRPGLFLVAAGSLLLASLAPGQESHRRHKKNPAPEADEDSPPSPAPTPKASANPAQKAASAPDKQPSSADEAAPSKAPAEAKTGDPAKNATAPAAVSTIDPKDIEGFDAQPEPVKKLLASALDLTTKNLTYTYGSDDPAKGGMDCSGTIYYLLKQAGFDDVPRQANEQYEWVRQKSHFYAVLSKKQDNVELREMRPGDMLFWTGTYRVDRDPPVTHSMIYLGKRKSDGKRLIFGSSDGRPYNGERRNGVSVFDFKMPVAKNGDAADAATTSSPEATPDFSGYGPIPGMTDLSDVASRQTLSAKAAGSAENDSKEAKKSDDDSEPSPTPKRSRHRSSPKGE